MPSRIPSQQAVSSPVSITATGPSHNISAGDQISYRYDPRSGRLDISPDGPVTTTTDWYVPNGLSWEMTDLMETPGRNSRFEGHELMRQQREELTGRRRRNTTPTGLFTPRENIDTIIKPYRYCGKVERSFGQNQVTRYRFNIRMWDGSTWQGPLIWDVSKSVFKDMARLIDQATEGSNDEIMIHIKRLGAGLRTSYHLRIWNSPLNAFTPANLESSFVPPPASEAARTSPVNQNGNSYQGIRLTAFDYSGNYGPVGVAGPVGSNDGPISWRPVLQSFGVQEQQRTGPTLEDEFFERNPAPNNSESPENNHPSIPERFIDHEGAIDEDIPF